ncbi:MAG: ATP-binding protein [archaeon]
MIENLKILSEENVEIIPDKSIQVKLGHVPFTLAQALGELIDNSIDAKHDEETNKIVVKDKIKVEIKVGNDFISIKDNSSGITNLQEAIRQGSSKKQNKLGTFGLGLKTACMNLGKKFTIISKNIFNDYGEIATMDTESEEWLSTKEWKIKISKFQEEKETHYTEIRIEKLYIIFKQLSDDEDTLKELSFRFSEFINNGEVEITFNEKKAIPSKTEFIDSEEFKKTIKEMGIDERKFQKSRKEFSFDIQTQNKIIEVQGWVDLLEKWSAAGRFGMNLYRGGRLIEAFKKSFAGIQNNPRHGRIIGHIYLPNEFPVTFTKDGFLAGRVAWKELDQRLKEEIEAHLKICNWLSQKKRVTPISKQTIQRVDKFLEMLPDAINKSDALKKLFDDEKKKLKKDKKGNLQQEGEIEQRAPRQKKGFDKPIPKENGTRNPKDKKKKAKSFFVDVGGFKIKITHDFNEYETPPVKMYYKYYDEKKRELSVVTNTYFDSWGITKDEGFYAAMNIVSALSEFILSQKENAEITLKDMEEELWKCIGKEAYRLAI